MGSLYPRHIDLNNHKRLSKTVHHLFFHYSLPNFLLVCVMVLN